MTRVRGELAARGRDMVLVGGLAVVARVSKADRATTDIDSVFDVPIAGKETVEILAAAKVGEPAGADAPQRRMVDGVPVDCIDTHPVNAQDLEGLTDAQALFVGSHRFACVTAEPTTLRLGDHAVESAVATPAGLIATKLHAAQHRRQPDKQAGDLFDLYQLLTNCDNVLMADALTTWPRLARLVRAGIAKLFITNATGSTGRVRTVSTTGIDAVTDSDLIAAGELFLGLLARTEDES